MKRSALKAGVVVGFPTLLAAACVAAVGYFAFVHVPRERTAALDRCHRDLDLRADGLKAAVELWVANGLAAAESIAQFPSVQQLLAIPKGASTPVTGSAEHVREVLTRLVSAEGHRASCVVDPAGRVVARDAHLTTIEPDCLAAARAVLASGAPASDFHRHSSGEVVVTFAVPVREAPAGVPAGEVVVVEDPSRWLYPYVAVPPMAESTAESLLVKRDGENALFLSPLRHDPAPPLTLRRPLTLHHFAAQEALGGRERFGDYQDYRGVPVFAATRLIRHAGWGLVTKVDQEEVLAPFRSRMWKDGLTGGALLLALLGLGLLLWRAQHLSSATALARSQARLALLLDQANDAILFVSLDGRIFEANQHAEALYGYSRQQLLGMDGWSLRSPATRADIERRLEPALRGEPVLIETEHRRADGSTFPVEVSTRVGPLGDTHGLVEIVRDVTDRKRSEEALRESEASLAVAQRIARIGSWRYDVVSHTTTWSAEMFRIFGRDSALGAPAWADQRPFIHPEDWDGIHAAVQGAINQGTPYRHEFRVVRPSGDVVWCGTVGNVERGPAGRVVRLAATVQDITERKQAEEEIRFRAVLLSTEQEASLDGILVVDDDGKVISFNQRFVETCGMSADALESRSEEQLLQSVLDRLVAPDEFLARVSWLRAHPRETSRDEIALVDRRVLDLYSAPMIGADGRYYGRVGYCRDITERKRMEEALRAVSLRQQALLAAIPDILMEVDAHKVYRWANRAGLEFFGDDVIGKDANRYFEGEQDTYETVRPLFEGEENVIYVESWQRRRDGEKRLLAWWCRVLKDEAGQVVGAISSGRDITERNRLETELLQAHKMEAVGRLAGGVAHDFNNLLSVISGYASLLAPELPAGSEARLKLDEIEKAAERAAGLTRQLLAFSRRQPSHPQALDLNAVIVDVEGMLRRLIGENIELLRRCAPNLWPVRADRGQIEQVIMNLAINARDAMPSGGKLTIATSNVDLGSGGSDFSDEDRSGPYVSLIVSDTGRGMDRGTLSHVFEPFFTTKELGRGTGLGLATVYGIVKQHGGHIEADSEPARGSTFRVCLPRIQDAPETPAATRAAGALGMEPRGSETVLLVEDEEALAVVVSEILATAGYEVIQATTPNEALERADSHPGPIHLLLTDVIMPQMNGRDLAERIRERRGEIKVIFISGYADDVLGSVLAPDVAFLQKPFSQSALLEKLREVLAA